MTAPRPSLGDVVTAAALTATLAAAALYAAGWFYALRFFDQLGVGLLGLNLPHESVLLYGALALARHWMWLALITLAVAALRWGMRDWTGPALARAVGWPERALLGLLAAIAVLSALREAALSAADAD
ncbi:MAG: hypothetical protein HQL39_13910, partial [Alphaproteobacteria bacterium]|nr:hypothetical protein [Alphaproteobacteria bacterium]